MRIFTFNEWSEKNIKKKELCYNQKDFCNPSFTKECIECYEDYIETCIPKYCEKG